MNNNRKTAIIVGILYIIATVAYSVSMLLLNPIQNSPDYLTKVFANQYIVIIGVFLILVDAVAVAGIGIWMHQILKKHNPVLALGFVSARVVEGALFILTAIPILIVLTLSRDAGALNNSYYETMGAVMLSAGNWTFLIGYGLVFAISALILNLVLYKSKLVPRWLSGWGFISAIFVLINFFSQSFGIALFEFLDISIAVQEMVFAVWLIAKGFRR
jgi:hypothetical protein